MNVAMKLVLGFFALVWLQPALCSDAIPGTYSECLKEPVFEGQVCTVQANRDASVGVVLIHGLNGSVDDWRSTLPALAANFHVVAFDLPGFGKSDKGSQEYSPTRYARLAHFLADHYFQNKPYHIVGHSMGGAIALRFAAQRPLRFQRLVLVDAAGILHPQVLTKFQAGSLAESVSGIKKTRGVIERWSGKILEQAERLPISPTEIVNTALGRDRVLQGGPEKIAALELAGENFSFAVKSVAEPTLIIWGDRDPTVPLRTGKVLAARMPRARLEIISDSGHEPMVDQPDRLNALIRSQLLASDEALAKYYHPKAPLLALASKRVGSCSGESDKVFKGDYLSIDLRDCSNVSIRDARVSSLSVINSRLDMVDTDIVGKDDGLYAENSDVTVTNGEISGTVAIRSLGSRLDLAGVDLKGGKESIKGVNSKFVFSISHVNSPLSSGSMHTFKSMVDETL